MKIKIRPFLTLRPIVRCQGDFEIGLDGITIRELLDLLCEEFGEALKKEVFDRNTNTVSDAFKILVNGRHYSTLPDRLETRLHENDEVALFPPIAGG